MAFLNVVNTQITVGVLMKVVLKVVKAEVYASIIPQLRMEVTEKVHIHYSNWKTACQGVDSKVECASN